MFEAHGYVFTTDDEIKILDLLKSSGGISFKLIHIEGLPYYFVLTKIRDYQKQGFTTNIHGMLGITEQGVEYLNQLLFSN